MDVILREICELCIFDHNLKVTQDTIHYQKIFAKPFTFTLSAIFDPICAHSAGFQALIQYQSRQNAISARSSLQVCLVYCFPLFLDVRRMFQVRLFLWRRLKVYNLRNFAGA